MPPFIPPEGKTEEQISNDIIYLFRLNYSSPIRGNPWDFYSKRVMRIPIHIYYLLLSPPLLSSPFVWGTIFAKC
jgi:hypothetical protein